MNKIAKRLDWDAIRETYITAANPTSMGELAQVHGCAVDTVRRHSSRENWTELRKQYRRDVARKTMDKSSSHEAEIRVRQMKIGRSMQAKGLQRLQQLDPGSLTPEEARRYLATGSEIERQASGLPMDLERDGKLQIVIQHVEVPIKRNNR